MEEIRRKYQAICSSFQRNSDGSWTCIKAVAVDSPKGELKAEPGTTFKRGEKYQDVDIAEWLDEICSRMTFGPI